MQDVLDIRMTVKVERPYYGGDYLSIDARCVYFENGELRYFSDHSFEHQELAKLTVHGQADLRNLEPIYAWEHHPGATYDDLHSLDLKQMERMVKLLRKIDRRMTQFKEELSYPTTYGTHLARVGKILKITSYGFEPVNGDPLWASGQRWNWVDPVMIDPYVNGHVERLRDKCGLVEVKG